MTIVYFLLKTLPKVVIKRDGYRRFWRPISVCNKSGLQLLLQEVLHLIWHNAMERYLARMWNLCSDALLQQQELSHHEMLHVRGSVHFDSISTNKERLTKSFPGYHSIYITFFENLFPFLYKCSGCTSFLGPSIVLAISWYLKGKALLILKHEPWERVDGKTLKKLFSTFGSSLTACWIHLRCF